MGRETAMQLKESLAGFNQSYAKLKSKAVDTLADRDIQRFDTKQRATKQ
jgi:hypothetical protein